MKKYINNSSVIKCSSYNGKMFVIDGHHRLLAHIINKQPFIRISLTNNNIDFEINKTYCYDFEDIGNFKYRYLD